MLVKSIYKRDDENFILPIDPPGCNGNIFTPMPPPLDSLYQCKISPSEAYEIVNSESYFDSDPQLNLATFVTTWMEPTAIELAKKNLDKNYIDKLIYPETIEIEKRCISILANLYHSNKEDNPTGTSTIGSTEAALLAALNYKFMWKKWASARGLSAPEIIIGTNVQVCWDKFAKYFEVKPIKIPVGPNHKLNVKEVEKYLSDKTICVVGILGNTFTGEFDDIKALNDIVDKYNKSHKWQIPIHVDAAIGGFIVPFYKKYKNTPWDFRLKWVKSINISAHKYGLVPAGLGWAIWRNRNDIDKELIFQIDYLGGSQDDFSLNFSKSASNIIIQYYNLTRLGEQGYEEIMNYLYEIQYYLIEKLSYLRLFNIKIFNIVNTSPDIPLIVLSLTAEAKVLGLNLATLAIKMKEYGWSIPVYPLPIPLQDEIVMRMVLKVGFNFGMADKLYEDITNSIKETNYKTLTQTSLSSGSNGVC